MPRSLEALLAFLLLAVPTAAGQELNEATGEILITAESPGARGAKVPLKKPAKLALSRFLELEKRGVAAVLVLETGARVDFETKMGSEAERLALILSANFNRETDRQGDLQASLVAVSIPLEWRKMSPAELLPFYKLMLEARRVAAVK